MTFSHTFDMIHLFLIGSIFSSFAHKVEPVKVIPFNQKVAQYCATKADITSDLDFTEVQLLQFKACYDSMTR